MNCYQIRDALIGGDLDLGVFYAEVGGLGQSLTTYPMGEFPVALVASPETAAQFSDFRTPDRQLAIPFLINEPDCIFRQIFENYLRDRSLRLQHTMELGSIPTIINLVRTGLGVTFLPRFAVATELEQGSLVELATGINHPVISAVCAHHSNKWLSPIMKEFVRLVGTGAAQEEEP